MSVVRSRTSSRRYPPALPLGILCALLAATLVSGVAAAGPAPQADPLPTANVRPMLDVALVCVGDVIDVGIHAEKVIALEGFRYRLEFDPTQLEAVDANPDQPGWQIAPGGLLEDRTSYLSNVSVDQVTGVITHTYSIVSGLPVYGTGSIARIAFRAKRSGSAIISFDPTFANALVARVPGEPKGEQPANWNSGEIYASDCLRVYLPVVLKEAH